MKKKSVVKNPSSLNSSSTNQKQTLSEIQSKLASSSALNGGFDTLLFKIDKIEQSQGNLVAKVDKIHEAIYDPQDGIFSKISDYRLNNTNEVNDVRQKITELQTWKTHSERDNMRDDRAVEVAARKIIALENSVGSLTKSKETAASIFRWLIVAVGGALVTFAFDWLQKRFN
jgi:hypothetical protein